MSAHEHIQCHDAECRELEAHCEMCGRPWPCSIVQGAGS